MNPTQSSFVFLLLFIATAHSNLVPCIYGGALGGDVVPTNLLLAQIAKITAVGAPFKPCSGLNVTVAKATWVACDGHSCSMSDDFIWTQKALIIGEFNVDGTPMDITKWTHFNDSAAGYSLNPLCRPRVNNPVNIDACVSSCAANPTTTSATCSGTTQYCALNIVPGCVVATEANYTTDCFCQRLAWGYQQFWKHLDEPNIWNHIYYQNVSEGEFGFGFGLVLASLRNAEYPYITNSLDPFNKSLLLHRHEGLDVFVHLQDDRFVVTQEESRSLVVTLRKGSWFVTYDFDSLSHTYDLPDEVFLVSDKLYYTISTSGDLIIEGYFDIVAERICKFHDCIFCYHAFKDWDCLPSRHKVALIIILIILICLVIIAFPPAIMILTCLFSYFLIPSLRVLWKCRLMHRTRVVKSLGNWIKAKYGKISEQLDTTDSLPLTNKNSVEMETSGDEDQFVGPSKPEPVKLTRMSREELENKLGSTPRPVSTTSKSVRRLNLLSILVIMLNIGFSMACSDGATLTSTFTDCVKYNATHETCQSKFAIQTTLDYPLDKSCYSIKNSVGDVYADVEVTFEYQEDRVELIKEYYTTDFELISNCKSICYKGSGECDGQDCEDFESSNKTSASSLTFIGDLFGSQYVNFPGEANCRRTPGCWAEDCFYCTDKCLYCAYALKPVDDAHPFVVKKLGQRQSIPSISILVRSSNGVAKRTTAKMVSNTTTIEGFQVKILGNLAVPITEFGTFKVIEHQSVYFGPAAEANDPRPGMIGAIQADTITNLKTTPTKIIYSKAGVIRLQDTHTTRYEMEMPPPLTQSNFKKLPMTINGNNWKWDAGALSSHVNNPGALIVTIEATGEGLSVIRRKDVVCPKFVKVISNEGCYDCTEGSMAVVSVKSTCRTGLAIFSTDDSAIQLFTQSVLLNETEGEMTVRFSTTKKKNDFQLCMINSGNKDCAEISFTAVESTTIFDRNLQETGGKVEQKGSIGGSLSFLDKVKDFFERVLKGLGKWWETLIVVLVFVAVGIAALVILPTTIVLGVRGFRAAKSSMTSMKMKKVT